MNMEKNKFWTGFLMICAFTFGWFLCIERETSVNVLHQGQTILNAGIRIFKGTGNAESPTLHSSSVTTSRPGGLNNGRISQKDNHSKTTTTHKPVIKKVVSTARSQIIQALTPTLTPTTLRLYSRNAEQWTMDKETCNIGTKFMQATLRTSAGAIPIFIHNPKDDIHVSNSILKHGSWEGGYINMILDMLRQDPDLQFLDLGANLGVYSMAAAKLGRKVIAVDALAMNIQRLCATVKQNQFMSNVKLVYNALSDVHEVVSLGADRGNIGGTFVAKHKNPNKVRGSRVGGNYGNVQTATLDDLLQLPEFDSKKVIIKMDVEGYENRVFRGGENFFKNVNVKAVLMEWMWLRTGPAGQEIINFLTRHGFQPTRPSLAQQNLPLNNRLSWPNDVLWRRKA